MHINERMFTVSLRGYLIIVQLNDRYTYKIESLSGSKTLLFILHRLNFIVKEYFPLYTKPQNHVTNIALFVEMANNLFAHFALNFISKWTYPFWTGCNLGTNCKFNMIFITKVVA